MRKKRTFMRLTHRLSIHGCKDDKVGGWRNEWMYEQTGRHTELLTGSSVQPRPWTASHRPAALPAPGLYDWMHQSGEQMPSEMSAGDTYKLDMNVFHCPTIACTSVDGDFPS